MSSGPRTAAPFLLFPTVTCWFLIVTPPASVGCQWCLSLMSVCNLGAWPSWEGPGLVHGFCSPNAWPRPARNRGSSASEDQNAALRLLPWGCGRLWVPWDRLCRLSSCWWGGSPLLESPFLPPQRKRPVQSYCCCLWGCFGKQAPFSWKFGYCVRHHITRLSGGCIW